MERKELEQANQLACRLTALLYEVHTRIALDVEDIDETDGAALSGAVEPRAGKVRLDITLDLGGYSEDSAGEEKGNLEELHGDYI